MSVQLSSIINKLFWFNTVVLTMLYCLVHHNVNSAFFRRRSEHTDWNVVLKPMVLFRTTPTHLDIVITWCYRKPFHKRKLNASRTFDFSLFSKLYTWQKTGWIYNRNNCQDYFADWNRLVYNYIDQPVEIKLLDAFWGITNKRLYIMFFHFFSCTLCLSSKPEYIKKKFKEKIIAHA